MQTYQILNAMAPTRHEKRRIASTRGYKGEGSIYQECEDPDGSGRRNCLDDVLIYVDHALVHHPDAALAAAQYVTNHVHSALAAAAEALPIGQLILRLQPSSERESMEAVSALSTAIRQMVLGGDADAERLLHEVEDAQRELGKAAVMLRAALRAQSE